MFRHTVLLDFKYASFRAHVLVSKWMAAIEKVRRGIRVEDPVIVIYDWIIDAPRDAEGRFILESIETDAPEQLPVTVPNAEQWGRPYDGIFYTFDQVILEPRGARFEAFSTEQSRKSAKTNDSSNSGTSTGLIKHHEKEFQSYEDEVYFFFRVQEFDNNFLDLVRMREK